MTSNVSPSTYSNLTLPSFELSAKALTFGECFVNISSFILSSFPSDVETLMIALLLFSAGGGGGGGSTFFLAPIFLNYINYTDLSTFHQNFSKDHKKKGKRKSSIFPETPTIIYNITI